MKAKREVVGDDKSFKDDGNVQSYPVVVEAQRGARKFHCSFSSNLRDLLPSQAQPELTRMVPGNVYITCYDVTHGAR